MQANRPKIDIPKTMSERIWDLIGYLVFLSSVIYLIYVWGDLPQEVPAHYNALGEVDRYGSKWELVILPGVSLFILGLMNLFERFPEWHNYPKRLNDKNAESFYLNSRKLVNQIKNISLIIFAYLLFQSVGIAIGWLKELNSWGLSILIFLLLFAIIIQFIKNRKIK